MLGRNKEMEEANNAVASKRSIFSENQDYKSFLCVVVNLYVPTRPKKHLKMNKEVRMLLPKKDLIQVE